MPSIPLLIDLAPANTGLTLSANVYSGATLSASPALAESPSASGRYSGVYTSSDAAAQFDWCVADASGNAFGTGSFRTDANGNEIAQSGDAYAAASTAVTQTTAIQARVTTALPNVAPSASGGLLIVGSGAGQIQPNGDGSVPTTGASGSGAFAMTVTITDGTNLLPGAMVRISGAQSAGAIVTDTSGNAAFALNSGNVTVTATADGYAGSTSVHTVDTAGQWDTTGSADLSIALAAAGAALSPGVGQTTAYLTTRDGHGEPLSSVTLTFGLVDPQASVDSFDQNPFNAVSDSTGLLQILLRQSSTYQARVATGSWTTFTTGSASSYALPEILGSYTD